MTDRTRFLCGCLLCTLMSLVTMAGCRSTSPPMAFYTLSSIRGMQIPPADQVLSRQMVIGIGPVRFPDFLDRPQIVTRSGPNRFTISEFNRWGGNLDKDFLNTLTENLSILLPGDQVVVYPWITQVNPAYRVALDIHQFEGQMGDSVLLNVTWSIIDQGGRAESLYIKRSIIAQPVSGHQDYDAMVSACSDALAELSKQIAEQIKRVSQSGIVTQ